MFDRTLQSQCPLADTRKIYVDVTTQEVMFMLSLYKKLKTFSYLYIVRIKGSIFQMFIHLE